VTLDLARIVQQIGELVATTDPASDRQRFDALRSAWQTLDSAEVNQRLTSAKTSFLLARRANDYRACRSLPPLPDAYTVVGTDGSFILPDRHSPARFYLLNIGRVLLRYGCAAWAELSHEPTLHFGEDELLVPYDVRRRPVNATILGLRRATRELEAAVNMLEGVDGPALALQDGTLILWTLEAEQESVVSWVLGDFLKALATFREHDWPVASVISAPASTDLLNTLRVSICDYPPRGLVVNCDECRGRIASEGHVPACDILPGVTDRYLLAEIAQLQPGDRTAVYHSSSKILNAYAAIAGSDDFHICFFYLHTGREVARVELPRWVAADLGQLDFVHAAIFDQCRKGRGYPVVLQEAHEMAVLSMADRRLVEETIERELARAGIVMTLTGKAGSKRERFV
jgi:hypothetical protein